MANVKTEYRKQVPQKIKVLCVFNEIYFLTEVQIKITITGPVPRLVGNIRAVAPEPSKSETGSRDTADRNPQSRTENYTLSIILRYEKQL